MGRGWAWLILAAGAMGYVVSALAQTSAPAADVLEVLHEGAHLDGALPAIKFDVVSFRPCKDDERGSGTVVLPLDGDLIAYKCQPIGRIIYFAYSGQHSFVMTGEPDWVDTVRYNFQAKVAPEDIAVWQKMGLSSQRIMVRGLLGDALNLKQHTDTTQHSIYNLVIAKGGIKFAEYKDGETNKLPNGHTLTGRDHDWQPDGWLTYQGGNMGQVTEVLATRVGRQVIDKTGLFGLYDLALFIPLQHYDASHADAGDSPIPAIFEALKKVGLELQAAKAETGGIVIDHIERPPEN